MKRFLKWSGIAATIVAIISLAYCNREVTNTKVVSPFLNLNDSVHYVGMTTCRKCHDNVYQTFIQTGMGQSFGLATIQKSAATYNSHSLVYDTVENYYYFPFWQHDSLFIREFRLEGKDTVHNRVEYVSYVIGSGQHTNSHLVDFHGFITQAPITFYTQKGQWDMAPGFEGQYNTRFNRIIGHECITCHDAYPDFVQGSANKYNAVPLGIDCERCHGPGSLHVQEKLAGHLVDTSKMADYTIVNPRRLSKDLQMSVCQRCHLQGAAVLNEGKHFDSFRPGMPLSEMENVFLPRFKNSDADFIMASQADRLRMSACYKNTDMTCLTCHNPHISVTITPMEHFNSVCSNCHGGQQAQSKLTCSAPLKQRQAVDDNCVGCHMPKSGSIDIPHVNITDHYIRKNYGKFMSLSVEQAQKIKRFLRLECMTKDNPTDVEMANGYLHFYESYSLRPYFLDSALYFLQRTKYSDDKLNSFVHYYYLLDSFSQLTNYAVKTTPVKVMDDWTTYRIGEAYLQLNNPKDALVWLNRAVEISPYNLDFLNKKAAALYNGKDVPGAQAVYEQILKLQPHFLNALTSLGFIYMTENRTKDAADLLDLAIALDPDHQLALLNRAELYFHTAQYDKSRDLVFKVLSKDADNAQAKGLLKELAGKTALF